MENCGNMEAWKLYSAKDQVLMLDKESWIKNASPTYYKGNELSSSTFLNIFISYFQNPPQAKLERIEEDITSLSSEEVWPSSTTA